MPLYCSLAPSKKHAVVYVKNFQEGALQVTLRPLWMPHDWLNIGNWLLDEFARGIMPVNRLSENHLQETVSVMLTPHFAQPFLGMLNNNPLFMIEVFDGMKQGSVIASSPHVFEKGDHLIRLLVSPPVMSMRMLGEYALCSCLDYFFSYLQVKRVAWEINEKDKHYMHLANRLGFQQQRTYDSTGIQVYLFTRENFFRFLNGYQQ